MSRMYDFGRNYLGEYNDLSLDLNEVEGFQSRYAYADDDDWPEDMKALSVGEVFRVRIHMKSGITHDAIILHKDLMDFSTALNLFKDTHRELLDVLGEVVQ